MKLPKWFVVLLFIGTAVANEPPGAQTDAIDKLGLALSQLNEAQMAHSERVIAYTHDNGYLARRVLNPALGMEIGHLLLARPDNLGRLAALISNFKPVLSRYASAFESNPQGYGAEYIDAASVMVELLLAGAKPGVARATGNTARSTSSGQILDQVALVELANFEQMVKEGAFTNQWQSKAEARFLRLKIRMAPVLKQQKLKENRITPNAGTALANAGVTSQTISSGGGKAAEDIEVSDFFEVSSLSKDNVTDEIMRCIPPLKLSAEAEKQLLASLEKANSMLTLAHTSFKSSYHIFMRQGVCVKKSPNQFPIFAGEAFYETINPNGVPLYIANKWYRHIAQQIAVDGSADVAYVYANGNAVLVRYWVDADKGVRLYYSDEFRMAGEWEGEPIDATFSYSSMTSLQKTARADRFEKAFPLMHRFEQEGIN